MSIAGTIDSHKGGSVMELAEQMEGFVREAAREGRSLHEVEQHLHEVVHRLGNVATGMFIALQGDGDLGKTVTTEDGVTLQRSVAPVNRPLQTVFGLFHVRAYVYARGPKKRIELRPIDARMSLPEGHASYLFEEFSQYFCVEQAFDRSLEAIERVLRQSLSKETLERINRRLGDQAEQYLDELSAPPAESEGELLVLTGDGKGVPLVKPDLSRVPIFDPDERRGNRRMATLAAVYSVDRYVRTAEEIVAALFRDPGERPDGPTRPKPAGKQLTARFARQRELGEETEYVSGPIEAFSWARQRIVERWQPAQPLVVLMDGAPSQWDAVQACLDPDMVARAVEILDVIHVSQYVWRAAKVFHSHREHQEAFARQRLLRILEGDVKGVITGLRRMATGRDLTGTARSEIETVCRYFEHNASRMRYDQCLAAGYPIATGVIEGACRHLVKDRLERSGMRWSLPGAQAMLHVRAIHQSANRTDFYHIRIRKEQTQLHPHRSLVSRYQPCLA
jgi:hypothetical protein